MEEVKDKPDAEKWDFGWKEEEQLPVTLSDEEDEGDQEKNPSLIPSSPQKACSKGTERDLPPKKHSYKETSPKAQRGIANEKDPVDGLKPEVY